MNGRPDVDLGRASATGWTAVVNGLLALVTLLVVLQLWLLTAALEAYLGGNPAATIGIAAIPGVAFLAGLSALLVSRR